MRTIRAALAFLLASPVAAEVRYASFASESLGREVRYAVDVPASYASGGRTYPVLYALHGLFESADFWERRGLADVLQGLREKGEAPEFLVVAVDGGNSFFVNGPAGRYQDLVTRDLIAQIESTHRVVQGREGRALLGVSMGGYAALRIALERPDLYRVAAAHSAMILDKPPTRDEGAGRGQMAAFNQVFGDPIDPARWAAADPLAWAGRVDPRKAPALYFDCGTEDRYGLFAGNEELHRRLLARGVAHTFALLPGNHGYEYVRSVLDRSLRFIAEAFRRAPPERPHRRPRTPPLTPRFQANHSRDGIQRIKGRCRMRGTTRRHDATWLGRVVSLAAVASLSVPRDVGAGEIPVSVRDIRFAEGHSCLRFVLKNESREALIAWNFTFSVRYPDGWTEQESVTRDCYAQPSAYQAKCLLQPGGEREVETGVPLGLHSGQPPVTAKVAANWVSFEGGTWPGGQEWAASLPEVDVDRERTWNDILAVLEDCRRKGGEGIEALQAAWARLARSSPPHPLKQLVCFDLRRAIGRVSQGRGNAAAELDLLIRDIRRANGLIQFKE